MSAMTTQLQNILQQNWSNWFSTSPPEKFELVKIAANSDEDGRVILLVFEPNEKAPRVIVKIPRSPTQIQITQQEYNLLQRLHQTCGQNVSASLPQPFLCEVNDKDCLYIESALTGKLMGSVRNRWHVGGGKRSQKAVERDFPLALNWLADFYTITTSTFNSLEFTELLEYFQAKVPLSPEVFTPQIVQSLQTAIEKLGKTCTGISIPKVCEHGDFWAGNLFITQNGLGVVDWADSTFDELPFYDAYFFISSYSLGFAPKENDDLWMAKLLFQERTWFHNFAREALSAYHQKIGIPNEATQYLLGLAIARKVLRDTIRGRTNTRHKQMLALWANSIEA